VKDCNFINMDNLLEVISDYLAQKELIEKDIDTECLVFKPSVTEQETPKVVFVQHLENPTYEVKYTGNIDIDFCFSGSDTTPKLKKVKRVAKDKGVAIYQLRGYKQLVVTSLSLFCFGDTDLKFFEGDTQEEKEQEQIRRIEEANEKVTKVSPVRYDIGHIKYDKNNASYIQIKYKDINGEDINDIVRYIVIVGKCAIYILLDDTMYNYNADGLMNIILSFFKCALPNYYKGINMANKNIFKPVDMEVIPTISVVNKDFFNKDANGLDFEAVRHEYVGKIAIKNNLGFIINQ
jgi:hypothetical protein